MTGSLDWESTTNKKDNSCKTVQCTCPVFWEICQQEAIKRLSNHQKENHYKLEPGYEARARRIASVYAKIYLEQEMNGNKQLIGRYYWMGLGAFASKTVAAVFKHGLTTWGYKWIPIGFVRDPVHSFAKGNLWLFMDIAPWHYAWSTSSTAFNQCRSNRNVSTYTHIKKQVMNLPWSNCLPIINNLQSTKEIEDAFILLPTIEAVFKRKGTTRRSNFLVSKDDLFTHLQTIAVQEQRNILQKLVWKDWKVQKQATIQHYSRLPDSTLVLSSDYDVEAVKPIPKQRAPFNLEVSDITPDVYKGRHKGVINKLSESVYSEPGSTDIPNYDSRMEWIIKAANKYHRLMLSDNGRAFLEKELAIIAGWGNSTASFKIGDDSNDGKI